MNLGAHEKSGMRRRLLGSPIQKTSKLLEKKGFLRSEPNKLSRVDKCSFILYAAPIVAYMFAKCYNQIESKEKETQDVGQFLTFIFQNQNI